jgi:hypothetical protein
MESSVQPRLLVTCVSFSLLTYIESVLRDTSESGEEQWGLWFLQVAHGGWACPGQWCCECAEFYPSLASSPQTAGKHSSIISCLLSWGPPHLHPSHGHICISILH